MCSSKTQKENICIIENGVLIPQRKYGRNSAKNNDDDLLKKARDMYVMKKSLTYTQIANNLWSEAWSYAKGRRVKDARETFVERFRRKLGKYMKAIHTN